MNTMEIRLLSEAELDIVNGGGSTKIKPEEARIVKEVAMGVGRGDLFSMVAFMGAVWGGIIVICLEK